MVGGPRLMPSLSTLRGYGTEHKRERRRWAQLVERGEVVCARCGGAIVPGMLWDLGHHDRDRTLYVGPEHRRCNRSTSGRRGRRPLVPPSRDW
jgi:hypothetical protein